MTTISDLFTGRSAGHTIIRALVRDLAAALAREDASEFDTQRVLDTPVISNLIDDAVFEHLLKELLSAANLYAGLIFSICELGFNLAHKCNQD